MKIAGAYIGPEPLRGLRAAEIPRTQGAGSRAARPEVGLRLQEGLGACPEAGLLLEEEYSLTDIPVNQEKAGQAGPRDAETDEARADRPGRKVREALRTVEQRQAMQGRTGTAASRPNPEEGENRPKGRNPDGSFCW